MSKKEFWSDEVEATFFQSFISKNCAVKPVGLNKHFAMLIAYSRFTKQIKKNVDVEVMWTKLETLFDLDLLDHGDSKRAPFPNGQTDFELPNYIMDRFKRKDESDDDDQPQRKIRRRR